MTVKRLLSMAVRGMYIMAEQEPKDKRIMIEYISLDTEAMTFSGTFTLEDIK